MPLKVTDPEEASVIEAVPEVAEEAEAEPEEVAPVAEVEDPMTRNGFPLPSSEDSLSTA